MYVRALRFLKWTSRESGGPSPSQAAKCSGASGPAPRTHTNGKATRTNMTMTLEKQEISDHNGVANDPRWARVITRDRTADGHLWYSVATTGVYCRPSCPSRAANPKNVQLHDTIEEAKATGFRPCKRCHPDGPPIDAENATIVARACRLIEKSEEEPSLADLAETAGRSPSCFHRRFKAVTGLTPTDYPA